MLHKILEFLKFQLDCIRYHRKSLLNKDFTIISNNCIGGVIYHDYNLKFRSPTINLYFFMPDYIIFLENFDRYIHKPLQYKYESKYLSEPIQYPIGFWDNGLEIHFLHYSSIEEANGKWEMRKKRINKNNLFVIGSDRDNCTEDIICRFDKLPFKNKVFFSSKPYPNLSSVIYMPETSEENQVGDLIRNRRYLNYFNLTAWFNTGKIRRYTAAKFIYCSLFS